MSDMLPPPPKRSRKRLYIIALAVVTIAIITVSLLVIVLRPSESNKSWHWFDYILNKEGNYESSVFSIHNPWRVIWSVTNRLSASVSGVFAVNVMARFDIEWHPIAGTNITTSDYGILYVNDTGSFYLYVIANDWVKWDLEVQEYR